MLDLLAHMRTFVDIIDLGSLAAVARARDVSPSSVTGALQRLEDHVGIRLIVRTTRSMALTADGEQFLVDCRRILDDVDQAIDRASDDGPLEGRIRISAINDVGRSMLAPLLHTFLQAHPAVHIDLELSDAVVDLIDDGFDLGLRTGPLADSRLTARLLRRSRRVVAASPEYWERHGRPTHPSQLADHNCLVLARPGHPQSTWTFYDGETPIPVAVGGDRTASAGDVLRAWAIAGAGVILKSDYDVVDDIESARLQSVLERFTRQPVNLYAVHPAGRHPARRVSALIDHLVQHSGPADRA